MEKLLNTKGLTLMEIIVSLGILGIVIIPLMNIFVFCQKVLCISNDEYKSIQIAQYYMEEIKAMDGIDGSIYLFDTDNSSYKRVIVQNEENYGAEIRIMPDENCVLHRVEIDVIDNGEIVSSMNGSVIFE